MAKNTLHLSHTREPRSPENQKDKNWQHKILLSTWQKEKILVVSNKIIGILNQQIFANSRYQHHCSHILNYLLSIHTIFWY